MELKNLEASRGLLCIISILSNEVLQKLIKVRTGRPQHWIIEKMVKSTTLVHSRDGARILFWEWSCSMGCTVIIIFDILVLGVLVRTLINPGVMIVRPMVLVGSSWWVQDYGSPSPSHECTPKFVI